MSPVSLSAAIKGRAHPGVGKWVVLLVVGMTISDTGCVSSGMGREYVYHTFEVVRDKDAGDATHFLYTYGAAQVNRTHGRALPDVPFEIFSTRMIIPETFRVEWETADGVKHEAVVPVRSQLHESIEFKTVYFVIHQDHVEGFIGHYDRLGLHIERRFY